MSLFVLGIASNFDYFHPIKNSRMQSVEYVRGAKEQAL